MNKHNTQSILNIFVFTVIAISSGCGSVMAVPSPTLSPASLQNPTNTANQEPSCCEGTIIYSDYKNIYSVDLQTQKIKTISTAEGTQRDLVVLKDKIYINRTTQINEGGISNHHEIFRMNLDGSNIEQLTFSDGIEKNFLAVSPTEDSLVYQTGDGSSIFLVVYDIDDKKSKIVSQQSGHNYYYPMWLSNSDELIYLDVFPSQSIEHGHLMQYSTKNGISNELQADVSSQTYSPTFEEQQLMSDFHKLSWSPDKTMVLQQIQVDNSEYHLYLKNAASSQSTEINVEKGYEATVGAGATVQLWQYNPTWSPDSKHFAFFTLTDKDYTLNIQSIENNLMLKIKVPSIDYYSVNAYWISQ